MIEVHQYWTSLKELAQVVEEVAAVVAVVVEAAVEVLEGEDLLVWEDCSRLECRS